MNQNCKAYHFNVSFDLIFANYNLEKFVPIFAESSLYYFLVGNSNDRIIIDSVPDNNYYKYLKYHEIEFPQPVFPGENLSEYEGFPWGWNEDVCERFSSFGVQVKHPPLDIIARVNSRKFSFEVSQALGYGVPGIRVFNDDSSLYSFLQTSEDDTHFVLKPLHGNSGIGFIHKKTKIFSPVEKKRITSMFSMRGGGVVYEPWMDRVLDISSRFEISYDGQISNILHHQTLNNRGGVFYGILLEPQHYMLSSWLQRLDVMTEKVGSALHKAGYWGPVGIDSFVYLKDGQKNIALLIEINARNTMSIMAYSLRQKLSPDRYCLFEFVPTHKYKNLNSYNSLGSLAFNQKAREGVFIFTPLYLNENKEKIRPQKMGFLILGDSREKVWKLDNSLRNQFIKK